MRFEKQISNVGSNNTGIKIEHNLFKFLRLKNLNKLEEKMLRLLSEFGRLKGFFISPPTYFRHIIGTPTRRTPMRSIEMIGQATAQSVTSDFQVFQV